MISLLVTVLLSAGANSSIAASNNVPVWRESMLVLSTGRAPYRPLYGAAIENVARDAPASILYLAEMMDATSSREWMALYQVASVMGPRAGAGFGLALAQAETDTSRWPLLVCLGISGDTSFAKMIEPYTQSADRRVRAAAAVALGDFGMARSVPALMRALKDTEASVRRIAADSLGRVLKKCNVDDDDLEIEIRKILEEADLDSDPWVRRNARKGSLY